MTSTARGARTAARQGDARRALILNDRQLVVDLVELTLNHGLFTVRAANALTDAESILAEWRPHPVVIDMEASGH